MVYTARVAKTIARGSGVPSPSSARSVVPSGPVSLYFIFLIRFYVDLCLPSVTLVMAKRVRLPHLLLRRLRPQGVRLTWLPMLRCLFNIFFLVPLELILLRYFRQMVLDDMAMEIATDPGVSSKDEVPNAPSASKKRAAPKDSEKVRSFFISRRASSILIERSLCSSIPDALRLSVYRMPLFLALTLIALLINAFGICSGTLVLPHPLVIRNALVLHLRPRFSPLATLSLLWKVCISS